MQHLNLELKNCISLKTITPSNQQCIWYTNSKNVDFAQVGKTLLNLTVDYTWDFMFHLVTLALSKVVNNHIGDYWVFGTLISPTLSIVID